MHADGILHVESAGAGPGVHSINDYAYPDTDRYTMTAPGDLIERAQGASIGDLGHGADPNELHDAVRLETGWVHGGDHTGGMVEGASSHSSVFDVGTTSFDNILGVMTGGDVSLYEPPGWERAEVNGQIVDEWRYPAQDPSYQPPMMDVP